MIEFDNELIHRQMSESIHKIVGTDSFDFFDIKTPNQVFLNCITIK